MDELEELRRKRMMELQAQANSAPAQSAIEQQMQEHQMQEQQIEQQIEQIMKQIMSTEARQRMTTLKMAKPEFARQVELMLIQLYQGGRLTKLTDDQLKALLRKISGTKRERKIEVR